MRLMTSGPKVLLLLGLGTALSGCTSFGPRWGGMSPVVPSDSLTVQRIRGQNEALAPLTTEPGDVWPREAGPRATLANPDEALRGFRPGEEPPPRRRGSSGPPAEPTSTAVPPFPAFDPPPPPPPPANRADQPRADGQVIFPPQGGPVTTTGGTSRVQTTISPQGSGLAIRDGATTTIIGPGGNVQQVPTPR